MAKRTETQLVVTAKDLGSKKLKELAQAFRALRQEQSDTAAVADRTKVKQGELQATLSSLNRVLGELTSRQAKLNLFGKLGTDLAAAQVRFQAAEKALKDFGAATDAAASKTTKFKAEQKAIQSEFNRAQSAVNKLSTSYNRVKGEVESLGLNSKQAQESLNRLVAVTSRAAAESETALARLPREQRLYREELEKTAVAERERLLAEQRANAEAKQRIALQMEALKLASRTRLAQERGVQSGFSNFSQRVDSGAIRNEAAAQRLIEIQKRAEVVEARLAAERQKNIGVLGRLAAALRTTTVAQERSNKAQMSGVDLQRTALGFGQRLRGQLLSIAAAYVGVYGVIAQGQRALDVSNNRIALNSRLLVANADNQKAAANDLKFLRAEADRLGFSLTELGTNYSKLAIAGRSAGLSTQEVRTIFSSFSEVARVNNLGIEETERVFKALEQILSKGKVQAEELRGQLGDVLPGAYSAFARSLGVTGRDLDKLLKDGRVSSAALVGFAKEYASSVAGQLGPATENLRAQLGRLNTAYDDFLQTIANEALAPAVSEVAAALKDFLTSAEGKQFGKELANGIRLVGQVAITAAKNLGLLVSLAKGFLVAFAAIQGQKIALGILAIASGLSTATTAARGFTLATITMRGALAALMAAAGPIGFVVAGLSAAWFLYAQNTDKAAARQDTLNSLMADAEAKISNVETAANNATRSQDALGDAELRLADAKKKTAEAAALYARTGNDAAKASLAQAKAAEEEARKRRDLMKVQEEAARKAAATAREEARQAILRHARLLQEAKDRIAVTLIAAKQAEQAAAAANAEVSKASGRRLELVGGQAAMANTRAAQARKDRDAAIAETKKLTADLNNLLAAFTAPVAGPDTTKPQPSIFEEEKSTKATKDKAAEEAKKLAEKARDEIAQINKDRLEQEVDDEAKALAAKLELVRIEYAERRAQNEKLIADLRASKQTGLADELSAAQANLDVQEKIAAQRVRDDATRASLLKELETREQAINTLIEERDRKLSEIERRKQVGAITDYDATQQSYEIELEYQDKVLTKTQELRDFIAAAQADGTLSLVEATKIAELLGKLDEVPAKVEAINPAVTKIREAQQELATGVGDSITSLATGIAGWISGVNSFKDALKGAWDTFRNFIADFLIGIAKAIIQTQLLKLIQSSTGLSGIFGAITAGSAHTGGIVGTQAKNRSLSPAIFAAAQRYHTGGVVGLGPDEVPIVAKRGEEVLTENDARHRNNGGGAGQQIKIINAIDSSSVVQEGMNSPAGTRAVMNVVRANKAAFKAALA